MSYPLDDPGINKLLDIVAPLGQGRFKRKERELDPQGSSLGRFRDGCHRPLACPSVVAAAAGIEPAIVSLTGSRLTIGPHRKKSRRWDLSVTSARDTPLAMAVGRRYGFRISVCNSRLLSQSSLPPQLQFLYDSQVHQQCITLC